MNDYYLKFSSQAAADAVLFEKFPLKLDDDLNVIETYDVSKYPEHSIDVVGTIYKPTGETTLVDGLEQPVMAALTGWHVNVRGPENEALAAYAVDVATPVRVWA